MWHKLRKHLGRILHHPATQGCVGLVILVASVWSLGGEIEECAEQGKLLLHISGEAGFVLFATSILIGVVLTLDPFIDGLELVEDALISVKPHPLVRLGRSIKRLICNARFHVAMGLLIISGGIIETILEFTAPEGRADLWSLGMAYFGLHATCNILARLKKTVSLAEESLAREPMLVRIVVKLSHGLALPWVSNTLAIVILLQGLSGGLFDQLIVGAETDAATGLANNAGICAYAANLILRNILVIKDAEEVIDDEIDAALAPETTAG